MSTYPYADRFEIHRDLPKVGLPREEVLAQLRTMAVEEDAVWETGKCSSTMPSADCPGSIVVSRYSGALASGFSLGKVM